MKNPPKELLDNEMGSYLALLKRIGFNDSEITKFEEPTSDQLTKYFRSVDKRANELKKVDFDVDGRKGL